MAEPPMISAEQVARDIARLDAAQRPGGDVVAVGRALERTVRMYPSAGDDRAEALMDGYLRVLRKLPADIALAALEQVGEECTFLPVPAEINARAQRLMAPRIQALAKAQVMALRLRSLPPERRRPPTPEERAAVAVEVGALAARMRLSEAARNADKPLGPAPAAKPPPAEEDRVALRAVAAATKTFQLPSEDDPAVQKWLQR